MGDVYHLFLVQFIFTFAGVKYCFSILLLTVMLMVQTPMQQVLRVTVLVEHYFEHKHTNTHIGVFDFLAMHYFNDKKQVDYSRDVQLPFKQCSPSFLFFALYMQPATTLHSVQLFPPALQQLLPYRSSFYHAQAIANIWQPPRVA